MSAKRELISKTNKCINRKPWCNFTTAHTTIYGTALKPALTQILQDMSCSVDLLSKITIGEKVKVSRFVIVDSVQFIVGVNFAGSDLILVKSLEERQSTIVHPPHVVEFLFSLVQYVVFAARGELKGR